MSEGQRLFVKVTRESLPQVKDKYPFLYLERGAAGDRRQQHQMDRLDQ